MVGPEADDAAQRANDSELRALERHNFGKDTEDQLHHRAMEAEADAAESSESLAKPAGRSLEANARVSLRACVEALDLACVELEQAQRDLEVGHRFDSIGRSIDRSVLNDSFVESAIGSRATRHSFVESARSVLA